MKKERLKIRLDIGYYGIILKTIITQTTKGIKK